jgi:hypothetical protein
MPIKPVSIKEKMNLPKPAVKAGFLEVHLEYPV